MARGARTRIETGIYRDAYGLAARVTLGTASREQRFPADADLQELRDWRDTNKGELLIAKPQAAQGRRTKDPFDRAVGRYLATIAGRPSFAADQSHLRAWVEVFRAKPRTAITEADVRAALGQWRREGQRRPHQTTARPVQPQTLRHRLRVLKRLWRVLDQQRVTPFDAIERPKLSRALPQDVPLERIRAVARQLAVHDPITHARFLVLASTGKAPAELMRATAADVDLKRRTWRIQPAKGREGQTLHLGAEMVAAWRRFIAVDAWGDYDTSRYAKVLRKAGWPVGVRPYNVRHALAFELLRQGADLSDIQVHLGHTSMETTRRHYAGMVEARAKQTVRLLDGRLGLTTTRTAAAACHEGATRSKQTTRKREEKRGPSPAGTTQRNTAEKRVKGGKSSSK